MTRRIEGDTRLLDGSVILTKLDAITNWSRKYSFFQYPFVTACCGMEFMSVGGPKYDLDRFGAALPRFSPRQADLLMVVGTISHKQAPILVKVYNQMTEPKWVLAFGVCAVSGGFYDNYCDRAGHRHPDSRGCLRSRVSATAGDGDGRFDQAAGKGNGRRSGRIGPKAHRRSATLMINY